MNPNHTIYVKIETMTYKGKEMFYKEPIHTELHKAKKYTHNYEYYYKKTEEEPLTFLGKFRSYRKYRSDSYFDDRDYTMIDFEKESIFENKRENIYCKGIPDSDENMCIIEDMLYEEYPVYYQK